MSMSVVFLVLLSPHYMYHKPHVMQYGSQPVFIDILTWVENLTKILKSLYNQG